MLFERQRQIILQRGRELSAISAGDGPLFKTRVSGVPLPARSAGKPRKEFTHFFSCRRVRDGGEANLAAAGNGAITLLFNASRFYRAVPESHC